MYWNFVYRDASTALPHLLHELLESGDEITSRAGVTKEITHVGITLSEPWRREILCAKRKPNIAAQIFESAWVLAGRDDVAGLAEYLPRAWDFSDDGETWRAGYGKRLRTWAGLDKDVDQLAYVVETLQASHASRQAVMSIWSPTLDTVPGKDIPCNNWLSFSSRLGRLDLMVAIRSNDAMWGWSGINAFEWSVMQEVVAGILGIEVGGLHFATTSFHLYDQHWTKARDIVSHNEGGSYPHRDSPRFDATKLESRDVKGLDVALDAFMSLEYDIRTGSPLAHAYVESFPEPMLQSWLRVLEWWWTGNEDYLTPLAGTRLHEACLRSVQPPARTTIEIKADDVVIKTLAETFAAEDMTSVFLKGVFALHREKHAAYGDSWKRRGEMLGIMANIARKVDRLGGSETADESSVDTAIDLMVYLAKYRVWIDDFRMGTKRSDAVGPADDLMADAEIRWLHGSPRAARPSVAELEEALRINFDALEKLVVKQEPRRYELVEEMLDDAYALARIRWEATRDAA